MSKKTFMNALMASAACAAMFAAGSAAACTPGAEVTLNCHPRNLLFAQTLTALATALGVLLEFYFQ